MNKVRVGFKKLDPLMPLPAKAHEGDAGYDVQSRIDVRLLPGETRLIPTGLASEIPAGYEIQVRPRSGLARKYGLIVTNSPGTVDATFRGEIGVIMTNLGTDFYDVKRFDRIAQLVINQVPDSEVYEVTGELSETERGENGYGSSGV